ncbi:serine/threonine-protein kinase [Nocardioides stalactiti]|uniref:serine/threonine-protein kinase n=1 Tax=Nocardioides stalactiti TaxID=2755356 RepID=UPI001602FB24|nr:serine/threonine-protein kinase [Nocardioides stalactiti]
MHVPQPGESLGHYRIERVLGQGGMGVVYVATDLRLGREVALKVITGPLAANEEFRHRFHHEALAMSRVQSPWIVQIHDHDEVDGYPYIVTQLVLGTDLGSLVRAEERLAPQRALRLCAQVARGLDDAHRAGVLHRDVKPGNVLLGDPGTPHEHAYLCDFGIATSDAASHHTATGMVAGTWAYLAPERTLGAPAVPASDLYAVGCMLWTCLVGHEPYRGTPVEMAVAHANAPVPQLAGDDEFSRSLNRVLDRVLAKEPTGRHPDGAALAADLERLALEAPDVLPSAPATGAPATAVHHDPPPPPPPGPAPATTVAPGTAPAPDRRRRWPLVAAAAVTVAALVAGTTWAGLAARDDDEPRGSDPEPEVPVLVNGDLDGDRLGDVLVQGRTDTFSSPTTTNATIWPLLSTGTRFGPAAPAGSESGAALLGDVDGDGLMDQVWFADAPGAAYRIRVITGTREIWEHNQQLSALEEWAEILEPLLADVDGDGRDDVVFSNLLTETGTVHAALAGDQEFGEPQVVATLDPIEDPVTGVGDLDGDGDDDLFRAVNRYNKTFSAIVGLEVQAYLNDGGTFEAQAPTPLRHEDWGAGWFLAGDPDGDGTDELVVTNGRGGAVGVVAYGDDGFGQVEEWLPGNIRERLWERIVADAGAPHFKQTLSDVDGDGDDDLVSYALKRERFALGVALSDGSSYAPYEEWGAVPCGVAQPCDQFSLVADVRPSIT